MAIARTTRYTGGPVDPDTGQVRREIFVSDATVFAQFMDAASSDDLVLWRRSS